MNRRVATVATGAVLLGILAVPLIGHDSARLERATTTPVPPTTLATGLTKTTRTSQIMTDDETLVRKLAERYLEAVNTHDDATIAALNCAKAAPGLTQIAADGKPVTMTGLERAPARERYHLHLAIGGEPAGIRRIVKRDGTWCVED